MADINETNGVGGVQPGASIRDQMKQEAAQRQAAQQQAALKAADFEDDEDEDVLEDDEEQPKSKLNFKVVAAGLGICIVLGVIAFMIARGSRSEEEPVDTGISEVPIVEESIVEEPIVDTEPVIQTIYTSEQMNNLRSIGITASELDSYMQNNVPYDYVYNTLMEQYWGWHLMNELPTYDMTSEEYKDVINQTWMSLPERHDLEEWTSDYIAMSYDVEDNLDYEKVTPYGNQLFLKIYLDDNTHDSWFFLNIKPEEWNQLGPKGNVVVNYTYQTHYKPYESIFDAVEDTDNIFIISATLNIIKSDFAVTGTSTSSEDGEPMEDNSTEQ